MKQVSTGGLSFQEIREGGKYYVDKSLLIKDMLGTEKRGVFLFTRPRRFGKTTNLTMLDAFFNIEYKGNSWFDGLAISDHPEYDSERNAYPVVFLKFSTVSSESYDLLLGSVRSIVLDEFENHPCIFEDRVMTPSERRLYDTLVDDTAPADKVSRSVFSLCKILKRCHRSDVVILMDEYDKAISNAFDTDDLERMVRFMGEFMNATVKENPYRQLVCITGATQVAKAGFFTGANNISVDSVFNTRSGERFGFTESEVHDILSYYGHPERFDEVREWYDGYSFGDAEVYNPFSVMMYVQNGFVPDSYWENSGRNRPMRWMLRRVDSIGLQTVVDLINGGSAVSRLHGSMSYEELKLNDPVDLFSLMVMTGYLNAVPVGTGRTS